MGNNSFIIIMSTKNNEDDASDDNMMMCCACCGVAEVDEIKLKECGDGCDLVRYCSEECQREDHPKHEKACKKRVAELRDELLFRQPESSHLGDCPICLLLLPLDLGKSTNMSCCSKLICDGCDFANDLRERRERLDPKCAFCRKPVPKTQEEADRNKMKRVEKNDPVALRQVSMKHSREGDYAGAFECLSKAAELGDIEAHYRLSLLYHDGNGVEKNVNKKVYHLEEAAIGGHPIARYNLGNHEVRNGNIERAAKHYIIAANLGHDNSLKAIRIFYAEGHFSKADYLASLRGYQVAIEATKSTQREAAAEVLKQKKSTEGGS